MPGLFRIGLKIGIAYPHKAALIIGERHVRISLAVPRQAVKAGAEGRHGISLADVGAGFNAADGVIDVIALGAPVIGITAVKTGVEQGLRVPSVACKDDQIVKA